MRKNSGAKLWNSKTGRSIVAGLLAAFAVVVFAPVASAQDKDKEDEITFNLVPNPKFVDCLRAGTQEEPQAHVTVIRGKLNDTLILDLDGIKSGLGFDLFTVQHSPFLPNGSSDPSFKNFGLAWYQSDIQIGHQTDDGHVRIKTILLDQIFGFDPAVLLPPTNTFHVGFWFNNPEDAKACGFDVTKPTPFNGEHKAGPLAMISLPDAKSGLGPLCTDPHTSTKPASCNP
jgi:hypothetical protein